MSRTYVEHLSLLGNRQKRLELLHNVGALAVSAAGDANASTNRLHEREVSERLFMSLLDSSLPIPALQRILEPVALLRQRLDVDP